MSDSDDGFYGPTLPPSMRNDKSTERNPKNKSDSSDDDSYGPALPPNMRPCEHPASSTSSDPSSKLSTSQTIGPSLPPSAPGGPNPASAAAAAANGEDDVSSSDEDAYGPALPPGFVRRPSAPVTRGPALPPGGLPPPDDEDDEDDEDVIGPRLPTESVDLGRYAAADLERRADNMKQKLDAEGRPVEPVREQWMLELPPDRAGEFGLGPRQFRKTTPQERGDTSVWTDTPSGRSQPPPAAEKPAKKSGELVELATRRRDERMAQVADNLGTKRKESLLDIHQKRIKKAKKEAAAAGEAPPKRREFDRDRDLGANRFDDAQRAAAIKRSRGASDMFSSGQQKFL